MSDKRGAPRGRDGYGSAGGTPYRRGGHHSKGGSSAGGRRNRGGRGIYGSSSESPGGGHSDLPMPATSQAESVIVHPLSHGQVRPIDLSTKFSVRSSTPMARAYIYDESIIKEERSSTGSNDSSHSEEKHRQPQPQQLSYEPRSTLSHSSSTGPEQVSTNLNRFMENHPNAPSVFPTYGPVAYPEFRAGPLLPQRPGQPGYQYFPSSSGTRRKGTKQVGGRGGGKLGPLGMQQHH